MDKNVTTANLWQEDAIGGVVEKTGIIPRDVTVMIWE